MKQAKMPLLQGLHGKMSSWFCLAYKSESTESKAASPDSCVKVIHFNPFILCLGCQTFNSVMCIRGGEAVPRLTMPRILLYSNINLIQMKKTILLLAMVIAGSSANAQLVSKKGEPILPQAGDWALGIEANPFLDYLGNMFGKSSNNNSPSNTYLGRQSIVGKYFVDSLTAYRVGLRIGMINSTSRNMVA